jgi:hypothetical protein
MQVTQVILRDVKLNDKNIELIRNLEIYKDKNPKIKVSEIKGTRRVKEGAIINIKMKIPVVIITEDFKTTITKGNKLRKFLKEMFGADIVDFIININEKY